MTSNNKVPPLVPPLVPEVNKMGAKEDLRCCSIKSKKVSLGGGGQVDKKTRDCHMGNRCSFPFRNQWPVLFLLTMTVPQP